MNDERLYEVVSELAGLRRDLLLCAAAILESVANVVDPHRSDYFTAAEIESLAGDLRRRRARANGE